MSTAEATQGMCWFASSLPGPALRGCWGAAHAPPCLGVTGRRGAGIKLTHLTESLTGGHGQNRDTQ